MQRVKEKAIQLLQDQIVDRVIGWRAGEFFYDLTPSVFTSVEDIEKNFVWSVFSGANLSKYLIAESRKGGKAAAFLKPCDSYSFVQLLKEHRILRESVSPSAYSAAGCATWRPSRSRALPVSQQWRRTAKTCAFPRSTARKRSKRPMRCCSSARPARVKRSSAMTSCLASRARKTWTAAGSTRFKSSKP